MTHTKGPWFANESDIGDVLFYAKTQHAGIVRRVGQVFKTSGSKESELARAIEDESNLALILAAPDLLAALKECLTEGETNAPTVKYCNGANASAFECDQ